jgi:1-acyl-sn-glycerol-3-phosphate acyltransferase
MRKIRSTIRFILLVSSTFGTYAVWYLLRFFIPNKQYWRQFAFGVWARNWVRICGIDIEVIGTPPKSPYFLVSNHLGYIDIPVIRSALTGVFVAKHEIETWRFAGKIVRNMGTIFVNRQNRRDIPRAGHEIIEALSRGEGVIVFPEGTSTRGDEVLPFNSSFLEFAARTDTPVSFVSISYRTPEGEPPPSEAVTWWDDTGFLEHLLRMLEVKRFAAVLNFGDAPVINHDRKQLAAELRQKVQESFIPVI